MPLQPFTFDTKPDIRLVVYGDIVYKIKVTCRQSSDRESVRRLCQEEKNHKDLEHGQSLEAHPYAFTLYVEERQASHRDAASHSGRSLLVEEQIEGAVKPASTAEERTVTEYGQKNRHDVEERDLKEFLRLQRMASEDDDHTDGSEECEDPPSGLQRVFNALVSPVRSFLGK